ncbi:MAG TPA: TonB-dependent receptor [Nitrospiraceae bacterium]|nr:TonB-dependent receptor [Nitrospiraceae bacterium]
MRGGFAVLSWTLLCFVLAMQSSQRSRWLRSEVFDPERGTQYEAGVKTALVPDRLVATLAFYHIKKKNVLTTDPTNFLFSVQTGEQRSQGVEFDITANLARGWNLIASYAYTDARLTGTIRLRSGTVCPISRIISAVSGRRMRCMTAD